MSAGTSSVRRTKASSATADARAIPNIAMSRSPLRTNARKTEIMMTAAELITRLVSASPTRTARRLSPVSSHSSYIRLTRKTW